MHHASCKPSDVALVYLCSQCGAQHSAEDLRDALETLLRAVVENHVTSGDCNQARNALLSGWGNYCPHTGKARQQWK